MICGVTRKAAFKNINSANFKAREIEQESNVTMRAYTCEYCGMYHLTKKEIGRNPNTRWT